MPPETRKWASSLSQAGVLVMLLSTSLAFGQRDDEPPTSEPTTSEQELSEQEASEPLPVDAAPPAYSLHPDPTVRHELRAKLGDERFRFCQDPKYRFFQAEKDDICPRIADFEGRCPRVAAACGRPPWEADMKDTDEDSFDWSWLDWDLKWAGALFKIAFWVALGIGAILLFRALLRQALSWQKERDLDVPANPTSVERLDSAPGEDLPAETLFTLARQRLDQGLVTESLHLTYRGMIRILSDIDWVKPHRSKTSGDYLRGLRHEPPPNNTAAVSEVTGQLLALDRERFRSEPRPGEADALWSRAKGLAARLTNVVSLVLCSFLLSCDRGASLPESPHEPHGPRGSQLFEDLLHQRAYSVNRRLHRVLEVPVNTTTVLSVGASLRPIEWATLRRWAADGGHLIVAGPDFAFLEEFGDEFKTSDCSGPLVAPDLKLVRLGDQQAFTAEAKGDSLALCGKRAYATTSAWENGWITVVADANLFQNASLALGDNASLAFHLIGDVQGHVEFLGPWTGRGAQDPIQSITRAGFGWWVLHILVLGVIYAWSRGKRMGPPVDPKEETRRAFTEHAEALSRRYEKARASGWALQNYTEWALENLRKRAPSTRADLKSLTRAISSNEREANQLREALTTGRRAHELGDSTKDHVTTFRRLQSAILGINDVSDSRKKKE